MKKFILGIILVFTFLSFIPNTYAGYVNGYYRKNGTYVNGYYRSNPDGNPYNNYSFPGNTNPYTGKTATGSVDSYLNNYYKDSSPSYYPSYTYPTTPSCPSNSYLSGDSCQCYSGYIVSGSSCVNASLYCADKIGIMSQYDSVSKKCECMSGYSFNGTSCVYVPVKTENESCQDTYGINSYSPTTGKCACNIGYEWDSVLKSSCVKSLVCGINQIKSGDKCLTPDQACQNSFGLNSKSSNQLVNSEGNTSCVCGDNYQWSVDGKSCVIKPVITSLPTNKIVFSRNLQLGSSGSDVKQLQIKLGVVSASGYFGQKTLSAVKTFQIANGLTPNGIVDSVMMDKINK